MEENILNKDINLFKLNKNWGYMENYLILMTGFPGTGKTSASAKLAKGLQNYEYISQNEVRRNLGLKKMPKKQEETLRLIDRTAMDYLTKGKGVIIDSVNRHTFRRQQIYGVASGAGKNVIVVECVCSEAEAKKRMKSRPPSDGLISDPSDVSVWDKTAKYWEDIDLDFKYPGVDFVSYLVLNTEENYLDKKIVRKGSKKFINELEKILI